MDNKFNVFRVFISSSFLDMHDERDYIRTRVFNVLDQELIKQGYRLEILDLRGSTAQEKSYIEESILAMCLDGVTYCIPYFVGIIGDRYGWIPQGETAERSLEEICRQYDIEINEVKNKSITYLEIHYGFKVIPHKNIFFYNRTGLEKENVPKEFYEGKELQEDLRCYIKENLGLEYADNYKEYTAEWDNENNSVTKIEELADMLLVDLRNSFQQEIKKRKTQPLMTWREQMDYYFLQKAQGTIKISLAEQIQKFSLSEATEIDLKDKTNSIMFISGDSGSGKTTCLSQVYMALKKEDCFVLAHSSAVATGATTVKFMVEQFNNQMMDYLDEQGVTYDKNKDNHLRYGLFDHLLEKVSAIKRLVILVDNIEMMKDADSAYFGWIDSDISQNIRIVVIGDKNKSRMPFICTKFFLKNNHKVDFIKDVIICTAKKYGKSFENEILNLIVTKVIDSKQSLSYTTALAEHLMTMTKEDYISEKGVDAHLKWMRNEIHNTGEKIEDVYIMTLERAKKNFGSLFVNIVLGLVGVSRIGLRDSDILSLIQILKEKYNLENLKSLEQRDLFALKGFFKSYLKPSVRDCIWAFENNEFADIAYDIFKDEMIYEFNPLDLKKAKGGMLNAEKMWKTRFHYCLALYYNSLSNMDFYKKNELLYHCFLSGEHKLAAEFVMCEDSKGEISYHFDDFFRWCMQQQGGYDFIINMLNYNIANVLLSSEFFVYFFSGVDYSDFEDSHILERENMTGIFIKTLELMGTLEAKFNNVDKYADCRALILPKLLKDSVYSGNNKYINQIEAALANDKAFYYNVLNGNSCYKLSELYLYIAKSKEELENAKVEEREYRKYIAKSLYHHRQESKNNLNNFKYYSGRISTYLHIAKFYENRDFIIPQLYFQKAVQLEDKASKAYIKSCNNDFYLRSFELFQNIFCGKDYLGYFLINTGFFREGAQILDEKRGALLNVSSTFQHNDRTEMQFANYAGKIAEAMMSCGDFEGAITEYEKAKDIYIVIVNNDISGKAKREYYFICKFLAYCYTKTGRKEDAENLFKTIKELDKQYLTKEKSSEDHPLEIIASSFEQKAEKARKKEYFVMEAEYRYAIIRLHILMSQDIEEKQREEHICRLGEGIYKYIIAVARREYGNEIYVEWFRNIFSFEELYNTAKEILFSDSAAIDLLFNATFTYARELEEKAENSMIANLLNINVYGIFEKYFEVPEPYIVVMNKVKEIYEDVE